MEPPAVVTLITNLSTQLQSHAVYARTLQDKCAIMGDVAHKLSQLLAAVGVTAQTATLAELHASQPALSQQIHDLNQQLSLSLFDPVPGWNEDECTADGLLDTAGNKDKSDTSRSRSRWSYLFPTKRLKCKPQHAQHDQHAASQSGSKWLHTHLERGKNIKDNSRSDGNQLDKTKGHACQGEVAGRVNVKGVRGPSVIGTEAGPSSGPSVTSSSNETGPSSGCGVSSSGNETSPSSVCGVSCSGNETRASSGPSMSSSGNETGPGSSGNETGPSSSGNETGPSSSGNETGPSSSGNETGPSSSGHETGPSSSDNETGPSSSGHETGPSSSGHETGSSSSGHETGPSSSGHETGSSSSGNETSPSSSGNEAGPSSSGNEAAVPSSGPSMTAAGAGTAEEGQLVQERLLAERESDDGLVSDKMKQVEPKTMQRAKPAEPPDYLLCPISRQMMTDPVVLVESGHTYQAASIRQWLFNKSGTRDPLTNQALLQWPPKLIRNHVVLKAAVDFLQQHPDAHSCLDDESINLDALIKELEQKSSPCTISSPSRNSPEGGANGPSQGTTDAALALNAAPAAANPDAPTPPQGNIFQPSTRFHGVRPGFVFKMGGRGLGYYADVSLTGETWQASRMGAVSGAGVSEGGSNPAAGPISAPMPASAPPESASAPGELLSETAFDDAVANSFAKLILRKKLLMANTTRNNAQRPAASDGQYENLLQAANYPLHWAVEMGWPQLVRALIARGVDANTHDQNWMAPLHLAVINGDTEVIAVLLTHGADVNVRGASGMTPLHLAVERHDTELIAALLRHGAQVNLRASTGLAPLQIAIKDNNTERVKLLLDHGADVNLQIPMRNTPLRLAIDTMNVALMEVLLQAGADVSSQQAEGAPLFVAVERGTQQAVELLLRYGASVWDELPDGTTPLHVAAKRGDVGIAEVLCKAGAILDAGALGPDFNRHGSFRSGVTPLHCAIRLGKLGLARFLLGKGANANAQDSFGMTALHFAVADPRTNSIPKSTGIEAVRLLLTYGADITVKTQMGDTAMALAKRGHWRKEMVDLLCSLRS